MRFDLFGDIVGVIGDCCVFSVDCVIVPESVHLIDVIVGATGSDLAAGTSCLASCPRTMIGSRTICLIDLINSVSLGSFHILHNAKEGED